MLGLQCIRPVRKPLAYGAAGGAGALPEPGRRQGLPYYRKKACVLAFAALALGAPAAARNGVDMDVVQGDPYFANGAPEDDGSPAPEGGAGMAGGGESDDHKQVYDPGNQDTFYNAQNWLYGDDAPPPEDEGADDGGEEVRDMPDHDYRVNVGLMPVWSAPVASDGIPQILHMENTFYLSPIGLSVRGEYLNVRLPFGYCGPGADVTWNLIWDNEREYLFIANHITLNAFYTVQWNLGERNALSFHAGAGVMSMIMPKFNYDDGSERQTFVWFYPQLVAGIVKHYRPVPGFSVDLGTDVTYPLMLSVPFPQVQLHLSLGWHFQ